LVEKPTAGAALTRNIDARTRRIHKIKKFN
jgi:hypothetical protein